MSRISISGLCIMALTLLAGCVETPPRDKNMGAPSEQDLIDVLLNDPSIPKAACAPDEWIENTHPLELYTGQLSYEPGDFVDFHIHSPNGVHQLSVTNVVDDRNRMHYRSEIRGYRQNYKCYDYSYGLTWNTTYGFMIPSDALSGEYLIAATDTEGHTALGAIVIRPSVNAASKDILFIAPSNTWAAYNSWGGGSFYRHEIEEGRVNSSIVSFSRPNNAIRSLGTYQDHLLNADRYVLLWLKKAGFEVDVVADSDLHEDPGLIKRYKVVILAPHSEYWSQDMYAALRDYVTDGGNLVVSGANSIYWKVNLKYGRIEVRKKGDKFQYGPGNGGMWRELGFPEAALIGVAYDTRGYNTFSPYDISQSDHWTFNDITLPPNLSFGGTGSNGGAASGWETDKRTLDSPRNTIVLAKGGNPNGGGADMVLVPGTGGRGSVFSTGSLTFSGSLLVDEVSSGIFRNVLSRFLSD